jgi:hypothetical protein
MARLALVWQPTATHPGRVITRRAYLIALHVFMERRAAISSQSTRRRARHRRVGSRTSRHTLRDGRLRSSGKPSSAAARILGSAATRGPGSPSAAPAAATRGRRRVGIPACPARRERAGIHRRRPDRAGTQPAHCHRRPRGRPQRHPAWPACRDGAGRPGRMIRPEPDGGGAAARTCPSRSRGRGPSRQAIARSTASRTGPPAWPRPARAERWPWPWPWSARSSG